MGKPTKEKTIKEFFLFSLAVMTIFGIFVRVIVLAPELSAAGPILVSHGLDGRYEGNCDICHRQETDWHKATFGYFENCMLCHGGAPKTTHPVGGTMSFCLGCHEDIVPSHDAMFTFPEATYNNCLGCHPPE
ncbi:MAG: hypothetical protein M1552_02950 [Firmicutes bacterium]|jgi:hypothetical protein|nr:hypothetical protein [Dethiobacter sp.]MCL4462349.1 hypothetical protein [Bacillota bacterium]MCL5993117.1 hypothetical protein [Bacillota bacterium]